MLAWLSVWSEVQTCICPADATATHCLLLLSLVSVKSRLVLPFWYRPSQVVVEKGPLNVCVGVCVCVRVCVCEGMETVQITLQRRASSPSSECAGCHQQGHVGSKTLHQQNPPVLTLSFKGLDNLQLQVDLYYGCKTMVCIIIIIITVKQ